MDRNRTYKLNGTVNQFGVAEPVVEIVAGPRPYLWIGGGDGMCFGVMDRKKLRALRDGLTAALDGTNG